MAYFLEYLIPAENGGADVPVGDAAVVGGTPQGVVHLDTLPARSRIAAEAIEGARTEAENLLQHSKAETGELYDDPSDSLEAGSGRKVATFRPGAGWSES
ncbi:hypothetical protein FJV46_08715 [Arthrobacter agilis]|uniref:hypothetical protein n=1 Tax=Arthrobacter agilis TaxID=37921 RepID=UPI000B35863F|nr:hypothetical protein [Arthrobacter agilis]OUM43203.1 hypothetical protein B8W74_08240 [Arthrobacter agilis]PPB47685.1 hypothetical protein CI784_00740 [Arthrobacter agilis]TPV25687.1 hypothetical protein FJV46_08715 [Arthrobacter agilis]VDR33472.1 Uncharacterised protein [Arthrobacter agilis]